MILIKRFYRHLILSLTVATGLALTGYEYWLERHRPQHVDGPFVLYHKGWSAGVYVSNPDLAVYLALGLAFIGLAVATAFLSMDVREPAVVRRSR